jgi:hypothetical protein
MEEWFDRLTEVQVIAARLASLLRIQNMPGSILGCDTGYPI